MSTIKLKGDLMEVSIVLPTLNEENSIGKTIKEIKQILSKDKTSFEIIVVDSDSEDRTAIIARREGAKVVNELQRGYGNALRKGFKEAKGKYVIMYDPDGSYDANTLPLMIKLLRKGYDYLNANRFAKLTYKSMSLRHYIGNKIINMMGNIFFHIGFKDMLSGYKGFRAEALRKLNLKAQKWDFNVEVHSKLRRNNLKFKEINTRYFPRLGDSKLTRTKAAWNNFRFMLMYSPNFVFIYPSILFMLISLFAIVYILTSATLGNISLIASTIVFIIGFQMFLFGIMLKNIIVKKDFDKKSLLSELGSKLNLGKGIFIGLSLFTTSFLIFILIFLKWLKLGKQLSSTDIKFSILGFAILMMSLSIITYGFVNETLSE